MAIGANWAEVWKPCWNPVWAGAGATASVYWLAVNAHDIALVTPGRVRITGKRKYETEEEKLNRRIEQGIVVLPPEPVVVVKKPEPSKETQQAEALLDAISSTRAANIATERKIQTALARQEAARQAAIAKAQAEQEAKLQEAERARLKTEQEDVAFVASVLQAQEDEDKPLRDELIAALKIQLDASKEKANSKQLIGNSEQAFNDAMVEMFKQSLAKVSKGSLFKEAMRMRKDSETALKSSKSLSSKYKAQVSALRSKLH